MFNKLRNLFRNHDEDSQEVLHGSVTEQAANSREEAPSAKDNDVDIHESHSDLNEDCLKGLPLAIALRRLQNEYGTEFIKQPAIVNALGDYNAFADNKPYKAIFKVLQSDGIYLSLIESPSDTVWENIACQYSYQISNQYGFKTELVSNLIREILIGTGKCMINDLGIRPTEPECKCNAGSEIQTQIPTSEKAAVDTDPEQTVANRVQLPSIDILPKTFLKLPDKSSLAAVADRVSWILSGFGINPLNIDIFPGPRYSLYEIEIDPKKLPKLSRNEKDIIIALGGKGCRIVNPIHNKLAIGIEIPNPFDLEAISLYDLFSSNEYKLSKASLPIALGMDASGVVLVKDLAGLNNLLICGGLQQGKTSLVNQIIASLLMRVRADDLKFVIANSNELELQNFESIPENYLANDGESDCIISDRPKLYKAFRSLTAEMEMRNGLFSAAGVKSIDDYNSLFVSGRLNPQNGHHYLPHIVCIVDEIQPFLDGKSWDDTLSPMFELTKNTGVHFIFTTRYTSVNTLTPLIRTYFPIRVSFCIGLPNESRLILDSNGATNLLNVGDLLISGNGHIERCQSAKCEFEDIKPIFDFHGHKAVGTHYILPEKKDWWEEQIESYNQPIIAKDPLFDEVARMIVGSGQSSTSYIQRVFCLGYNRAGKIMDQLESAGIVGPSQGGKPRPVLVDLVALESILNS